MDNRQVGMAFTWTYLGGFLTNIACGGLPNGTNMKRVFTLSGLFFSEKAISILEIAETYQDSAWERM